VSLDFTIPGPFVSGNHAKTRDGRRTSRSREFDEKVRMIAAAAARTAQWVLPDYVHVDLTVLNVGIDADNLAKEVLDPMQGIAFAFDSRIIELSVLRRKAKDAEPYVRVKVTPANGALYGFPPIRKPKKKAV
jgi:Holliday junction resolvase RusA-like endonuclease